MAREIRVPDYITVAGEARPTRKQVIHSALWDVRDNEPGANGVRVADWIEAYLTAWESAAPTTEAPDGDD